MRRPTSRPGHHRRPHDRLQRRLRAPAAAAAGRALVAHEVLHIALRHAQRYQALQQRTGDADLQLFNVCADAIVNSALAHLGWLQLPPVRCASTRCWRRRWAIRQDAEAALLAWDVERLYRRWTTARPAPRCRPRMPRHRPPARRQVPALHSRSRDPAPAQPMQARTNLPQAPHAATVPRRACARTGPRRCGRPEARPRHPQRTRRRGRVRARVDRAPAARPRGRRPALDAAHAAGRPAATAHALGAGAAHAAGAWPGAAARTVVVAALALLAGQPGAQRRGPPPALGARHHRVPPVPRLVVVVDVSGSIDTPLMDRFASEVESMSRRLEAGLVLVVGDDRVRVSRPSSPAAPVCAASCFGRRRHRLHAAAGRGPAHRPDITVVLTDLEGPARVRPRCPVIWAVPEAHRDAVPPFGRLLVLH
jgi:hypothetical protein